MVLSLWKTAWQFLIKLNIYVTYKPVVTLLGICPREMKTCLHKNLYVKVHSSLICNHQKSQTNKMSIGGECIFKLWCSIQLNMPHQEKEKDYCMYCNIGESQNNYLEGNSHSKTEEKSTYSMIPFI